MIIRSFKWGLVAASAIIVLGGLMLGRDLPSYVSSSAKSSVPKSPPLMLARPGFNAY